MPERALTEPDLDEIERRWKAATPGPWTYTTAKHEGTDLPPFAFADEVEVVAPDDDYTVALVNIGLDAGTAEAIASAPDDVAALLAEVRRLRGVLEALVGRENAGYVLTDTDLICAYCERGYVFPEYWHRHVVYHHADDCPIALGRAALAGAVEEKQTQEVRDD